MGKEESNNVHEEYKQAFRTKSYLEIRSKIQCQLDTSSTSSCNNNNSISERLLEPLDESAIPTKLHRSLASYFEVSHEATRICESLLVNVHQARDNHRPIKNVLAFVQREPDCSIWTHDQYRAVYKNLASFASKINPFSKMGPENFQELHISHMHLFHDLTSQCKKAERKRQLIRYMGLGAAPGLGKWALAHFMKKWAAGTKCSLHEKWPVAKLDVAARGMFTMMNDFDSLSWVATRLRDEMEHRRFVTEICVRTEKNEALVEVVRDFQVHESRFLEQLEELEKEICLCFLDINRSRRLLC